MTAVSSQATNRGTGACWRGWGESAADGVQLVGEADEAAMSELSILILIMVMRQIHRIYCSDVGDL